MLTSSRRHDPLPLRRATGGEERLPLVRSLWVVELLLKQYILDRMYGNRGYTLEALGGSEKPNGPFRNSFEFEIWNNLAVSFGGRDSAKQADFGKTKVSVGSHWLRSTRHPEDGRARARNLW